MGRARIADMDELKIQVGVEPTWLASGSRTPWRYFLSSANGERGRCNPGGEPSPLTVSARRLASRRVYDPNEFKRFVPHLGPDLRLVLRRKSPAATVQVKIPAEVSCLTTRQAGAKVQEGI